MVELNEIQEEMCETNEVDYSDLRPLVHLAAQVGEGLGGREVLLQALSPRALTFTTCRRSGARAGARSRAPLPP